MTTAHKVRWRRSAEDRDCGAAAFAMVMSYHGCALTTEEARDIVKTDRTGTSMAWMCEGARSLGFEAQGARATYEGLAQVPLPAICHYDDGAGHYVVVTRWSPRSVTLLDPFFGRQRMSRSAFEELFSGFVVDLRPTEHVATRPNTVRARDVLVPYLRRHGMAVAAASLLGAGAVLLGLVLAGLLGHALDTASRGDRIAIAELVLKLSLAAGAVFVAQLIRMWLVARAGQRLELLVASRFVERIRHAPVRNFEERCPVAFGGRLVETTAIRAGFADAVTMIASSVLVVVVATIVLFRIDLALGLALCLSGPFLLAATQVVVGSGNQAEFRAARMSYRFFTRLVDGFTEFHTVKMFNGEEAEIGELNRRIVDRAKANNSVGYARELPAIVSGLLAIAVQIGLLVVITSLLSDGAISAGETLTSFAAIGIGIGAIRGMPTQIQRVSAALVSLDRLQEIMHMPVEHNVDQVTNAQLDQLFEPHAGSQQVVAIEANNVDYGPPNRSILQDLSFRIVHGERVAIVGETGSGKTTIARMLAMFEPINAGTLRLFGEDVTEMRPDTVRSLVSVVFQDTRLLQRSLLDNLLLGLDPAEIGEGELDRVLRMCGLEEVVSRQRRGLDTHAARAGRNFSSGQGQRFALARALLHKPPILVLDEATANVDSALEAEILERVVVEREGMTTIVMAHRFATLSFVDRVLVVRDGRVVEHGSVDDLSTRDSEFKRLFDAQLAGTSSPSQV